MNGLNERQVPGLALRPTIIGISDPLDPVMRPYTITDSSYHNCFLLTTPGQVVNLGDGREGQVVVIKCMASIATVVSLQKGELPVVLKQNDCLTVFAMQVGVVNRWYVLSLYRACATNVVYNQLEV